MSHDDYLLTLHISPSLEEAVVDCLLTLDNPQGFSFYPINAQNQNTEGLSIDEQVSGRRRKISFQMYADKKNIAVVLNQLKADFSGSGMQYWVSPVVERGEI
jgi:lipid-binding SYLF domain-containing protein